MKTITAKSLLQVVWLPLLLIVLLSSCSTRDHKTDHPDFFDQVIKNANNIHDNGHLDAALAYLDSVYGSRPDAGPADLYQEYIFKANHFRGVHDPKKADLYADSILYVIAHSGNEQKYNLQYAEANLLKGDILFDQGMYNAAYQYYYLEKRIVDNKADSCAYNTYLALFNNHLAVINYMQGNYKNSAYYYSQSLLFARHDCKTGIDYLNEMQGVLSNLAFSYERAGMPDSTLYYYNICLDLLNDGAVKYPEKSDFIAMARGVVYGNLGDIYMVKGHFDIADSLYRKDININSQKGYYNQDALITKVKLARLYLNTGRVADAGTVLTGMGNTSQLAAIDSRVNFLQTRAAYYKATGQDAAAVADLQYYITLKDSMELYKSKLTGTNINSVFQARNQENDIYTLKKQDQLKNMLLFASILFLLMGLLIVLLTIRNSRQVKKHTEEVKKRNKEQQFALIALELRNRENARMASVLAHDLKNPIHAIASIASLLLDEPNRSANDMEMLGLVQESVSNLSDMIDDVLINRNKSGAITLNTGAADLSELLKHSVSLLQFKAKEKDQVIQYEGLSNVVIQADSDQIWRVINNLIVNAIKFSPKNTTIKVALQKQGKMVQVSVADEGIGIPEDFGNKIFDLFTETKRTGTSGEETFGLGLYISRHIIEAHGGKIWFENAPGKGTIFYVTLPVGKVMLCQLAISKHNTQNSSLGL